MNHKRKRPKNARAGCLMCKNWKINHFGKERTDSGANWKRRINAGNDLTQFKKGEE